MSYYLKDNSERRRWAYIAIVVMLLVNVIGLVVSILGVFILDKIEDGYSDMLWIDQFDNLVQINGILYLTSLLFAAVVFILWFRRAYYNVHQFALTSPKHSEGWAAGSWFVPILSLFRPVQIMREIWLETIAFLRNRSPIMVGTNFLTTISLWWWTWIIGSILSNASVKISGDGENLGQLKLGYCFDALASVLFIVAAIYLLKIIKEYGELEEEVVLVNTESENDSIFYASPKNETI